MMILCRRRSTTCSRTSAIKLQDVYGDIGVGGWRNTFDGTFELEDDCWRELCKLCEKGSREQKSAGRKLLHALDGRSAETDDEGDTPSGFAAWRSFSFSSFSPLALARTPRPPSRRRRLLLKTMTSRKWRSTKLSGKSGSRRSSMRCGRRRTSGRARCGGSRNCVRRPVTSHSTPLVRRVHVASMAWRGYPSQVAAELQHGPEESTGKGEARPREGGAETHRRGEGQGGGGGAGAAARARRGRQ